MVNFTIPSKSQYLKDYSRGAEEGLVAALGLIESILLVILICLILVLIIPMFRKHTENQKIQNLIDVLEGSAFAIAMLTTLLLYLLSKGGILQ